MISGSRHPIGMVALAAAALCACSAPAIMDAGAGGPASNRHSLLGVATANLVKCPVNESASATSMVGPLGGIVSVGGTSISIPAGALLSPVEVTVTVPQSKLMEVDISVTGAEHFVFEQPVTVTLSYARCTRGDIDATPLSVWYIDSGTKEPLEAMGGVDNKLLRTVTFMTPHLSGYAIAN